MKDITPAEPGEIDAWVVLGYLQGVIEYDRRISIDRWNGAIKAGRESKARTDAVSDAHSHDDFCRECYGICLVPA